MTKSTDPETLIAERDRLQGRQDAIDAQLGAEKRVDVATLAALAQERDTNANVLAILDAQIADARDAEHRRQDADREAAALALRPEEWDAHRRAVEQAHQLHAAINDWLVVVGKLYATGAAPLTIIPSLLRQLVEPGAAGGLVHWASSGDKIAPERQHATKR